MSMTRKHKVNFQLAPRVLSRIHTLADFWNPKGTHCAC